MLTAVAGKGHLVYDAVCFVCEIFLFPVRSPWEGGPTVGVPVHVCSSGLVACSRANFTFTFTYHHKELCLKCRIWGSHSALIQIQVFLDTF